MPHICQWIGSALVQILACHLFGTKPLSKPMLGYCPLGTNFSEILIKIQDFSLMKMHVQISSSIWWPFCPGGDELKYSVTSAINLGHELLFYNMRTFTLFLFTHIPQIIFDCIAHWGKPFDPQLFLGWSLIWYHKRKHMVHMLIRKVFKLAWQHLILTLVLR